MTEEDILRFSAELSIEPWLFRKMLAVWLEEQTLYSTGSSKFLNELILNEHKNSFCKKDDINKSIPQMAKPPNTPASKYTSYVHGLKSKIQKNFVDWFSVQKKLQMFDEDLKRLAEDFDVGWILIKNLLEIWVEEKGLFGKSSSVVDGLILDDFGSSMKKSNVPKTPKGKTNEYTFGVKKKITGIFQECFEVYGRSAMGDSEQQRFSDRLGIQIWLFRKLLDFWAAERTLFNPNHCMLLDDWILQELHENHKRKAQIKAYIEGLKKKASEILYEIFMGPEKIAVTADEIMLIAVELEIHAWLMKKFIDIWILEDGLFGASSKLLDELILQD
jgi:hypothetical protein